MLAEHQKPNGIEKRELNDIVATRVAFSGFLVHPKYICGAPSKTIPGYTHMVSNMLARIAVDLDRFMPSNSVVCCLLPVALRSTVSVDNTQKVL